jgi:type IV pilus assembly protein PilN
MIRINLLPEVKRKAPRKKLVIAKQIPFAWIVAGLVAVVLAGAASLVFHLRQIEKLSEKQRDVVRIQEDIKKFKVQQGLVEKARQQRNSLTQKLEVINTLKQRQSGPVHLLNDLAGAIPPKLWLSQMSETGGAMTLGGFAVDNKQIALFMENLAKDPLFGNIELVNSTSASAGRAGDTMPTKSFTVNCRINATKEKTTTK